MTESKIPGLFAKLRELDRETYNRFDEIDDNMIIYEKVRAKVFDYLIHGVIQDAIAARHGWELQTYMSGKKQECRISTGSYYWLTGKGETPAEAHLAAYVAALDAEATR